jgi:hypothetical protein
MAVGIYGITRPSDVDVNDVEIYYNYMPDRQTSNNDVFPGESTWLENLLLPDDEQEDDEENLLEGFYNLRLPADIFTELGIYTIYLRPKVFRYTIEDCGVLAALPTVKGIVLKTGGDFPDTFAQNNALQGYKVEYINADGTKLRNTVRYVVTSNRVSPITTNVGNTSQRATRYTFDDNGSLVFLQLTPSSSSDVKPNALPFIGNVGDTILLSNTFFKPMAIEVELVANTLDTIANIVAGEQIKDVQNGILTYYDENRVITKQFNLFEIKDDVTDVPLYEVKEKRTAIDSSQDFNDVIDGVQ